MARKDEMIAAGDARIGKARIPRHLINRNLLFFEHQRILKEHALSRFDWRGLPTSCSERVIEMSLLHGEPVAIFPARSSSGRVILVSLPARGSEPNIYGDFTQWTARALNGHAQYNLSAEQCVVIQPNILRESEMGIIDQYATRLAELDRTIDINAEQARRPRALIAGPDQELSMRAISGNISDGVPVIGMRDVGALDRITSVDLGVRGADILSLQEVRERVRGQALIELGIDYVADRDRDRLIADEAGAMKGGIEASRRRLLFTRQKAAALMNRKWGLRVRVVFADPQRPHPEGIDGSGVSS